jgi:hypothetical protein
LKQQKVKQLVTAMLRAFQRGGRKEVRWNLLCRTPAPSVSSSTSTDEFRREVPSRSITSRTAHRLPFFASATSLCTTASLSPTSSACACTVARFRKPFRAAAAVIETPRAKLVETYAVARAIRAADLFLFVAVRRSCPL